MSKRRSAPRYPEVDPSPDIPRMELDTIEYWELERIFERSVEARPRRRDGSNNEFVFYDGPPFANGLPHYGHLATGFVKDLVPRYKTMRGIRVERRFGWDCHGLPAELTAERELGISGRAAILEYGVDRFNEHCRESVLRFTNDWRFYVTRQGRWVDFENAYKTMDLSFMESVLWAFKRLYEKGLIYRGWRVVPYSWAVQTPLSNFETRLDNSYRERQDPAVTVRFELEPTPGESMPVSLAAWTTTPWTLPSNLALAIHPDYDYALLEKDGERLVMAEAAVARYQPQLEGWRQVSSLKGAAFVGRRYRPLFPYFADTANAFRVLAADYVTLEDGTGIVHAAPAFGEEDMELGLANGLPLIAPVDERGAFTSEVPDYAGLNVFEANTHIIRDLKARGVVLRHESYLHNYPHCWRTDTPLIYRAIDAYYVRVSEFRDSMAGHNRGINWIPAHVRDGLFGNWLENARDWNISRNRFWGCPIPVWESDDPRYPRTDVYGSLDELERDFGHRPDDLHRPYIDRLVRPNPDDPTGKSMMRRVPEVLDVWFDSGSMPFAQLHYPFENKERFEENFPADFIVEYIAQTRGWFYTLIVLSTALFDRAPFENCVCHGVVLGADKLKLSKRLRNYPDPAKVFSDYGADALRVHVLSSALLAGGDLVIHSDARGVQEALRRTILPLWNAYYFFTLYANADDYAARPAYDSSDTHDRYILAKTRRFVFDLGARLDAYDIPGAYGLVGPFIDTLNNWHIRRNRARFWGEGVGPDKAQAFDILWTVLTIACRALAPLIPFLTERIYRGLTGEDSVHLTDWPDVAGLPDDEALVRDMDLARDVCSAGLATRVRHQLRQRQPLRTLTVAHPLVASLRPYARTIAEEVNVKQVLFEEDPTALGKPVLKVDPKIGRRIGGHLKEVLRSAAAGDWEWAADGRVAVAGLELEPAEFSLLADPSGETNATLFDGGKGRVVLDLTLDDTLRDEATARDFVRSVQEARKQADLHVSDRIRIVARAAERTRRALDRHRDFIMRETLALDLRFDAAPPAGEVADDVRVERV
jgi:isoleucyl-tRNA synthetase